MGQNNKKLERVMDLIFENPEKGLKVREISRQTKVPKTTVHRYLYLLKKEKLVDKENKLIVTNYTKFIKTIQIIKRLFSSGLIDYLEEKLVPSAIILFGSARKGEYTKNSDIDLFIESTKDVDLNISAFERKIGHKIQLFIEIDINKFPNELFNNVINGIKLSGYIKVR